MLENLLLTCNGSNDNVEKEEDKRMRELLGLQDNLQQNLREFENSSDLQEENHKMEMYYNSQLTVCLKEQKAVEATARLTTHHFLEVEHQTLGSARHVETKLTQANWQTEAIVEQTENVVQNVRTAVMWISYDYGRRGGGGVECCGDRGGNSNCPVEGSYRGDCPKRSDENYLRGQ